MPIDHFARADHFGLFSAHAAKEKERRAQIGKLGRAKEDTTGIIRLAAGAAVLLSGTVGLWVIGLYVVVRWIFKHVTP